MPRRRNSRSSPRSRAPRPAPPPCGPSPSRLRAGDHEIVARHRPAQQAREDVLRDAAAVAVGGLHQGPARLDEHAQLVGRGVAVGVVAPRHRAQADPRHLQPAAAHPSSLHVGSLSGALSRRRPHSRYGAAP